MPTSTVYSVKLCAPDYEGPNKNRSTFIETTLPASHPVFHERPTPISQKLNFPLVWRLNTRTTNTNNTRVAWLIIGIESILAPIRWQDDVGDVVVARADKQPLSVRN